MKGVKMIKRFFAVFFCFLFLGGTTSCRNFGTGEKQTEYHDQVAGLEQYVLEEYDEYIEFLTPEEENGQIEWDMYFLRSYMRNDDMMDSKSIYEIMEGVRERINEYLCSNKLEYFDGKAVLIRFWRPDITMFSIDKSDVVIGWIYNYDYADTTLVHDTFTSVAYYPDFDWNCIKGKDDIYQLEIKDTPVETVLEVIDSLPNIRYVYVSHEYREELSELRPDVEFW